MHPSKPAAAMSPRELAAYIDHSILKPEFTTEDVERETRAAVEYGCKTVCINPASVSVAAPLCEGTDTGVCVVVDFPFGASSTESKVAQTQIVLDQGVDEVDIVANYGWVRSGLMEDVEDDLRAVIEACHARAVAVKVIFETDALTHDQIAALATAALNAGADFLKTSTGFYTGILQHGERSGAFDEMVAFMMQCADGRAKVKGSGAIRDRAHFLRLIDMGVDRMGIGFRSTPLMLDIDSGSSTAPTATSDSY